MLSFVLNFNGGEDVNLEWLSGRTISKRFLIVSENWTISFDGETAKFMKRPEECISHPGEDVPEKLRNNERRTG